MHSASRVDGRTSRSSTTGPVLDEDLGDIYDVIDATSATRPVYVIRGRHRPERSELGPRYELEYLDGSSARDLTRVIGPRGDGP